MRVIRAMDFLQKDTSPVSESLSSSSSANQSSLSTSSSNQNSNLHCPHNFRDLNLEDEFMILKTLSEGTFSKVLLAKHKEDKMVLKLIHSDMTTEEEFLRELTTNYFLSPHPNIVSSYNVSFFYLNSFVFVEEHAPCGDLARFVRKGGLSELQGKGILRQLGTALDFIHSLNLVHRDIKLENVLVFKSNLSVVKLGDFGETRAEGSMVRKTNRVCVPYLPPEVSELLPNEKYYCSKGNDVWQLGILLYVTLMGATPWQTADITDPSYNSFVDWLRKKSLRVPDEFKSFTPRLLRLFKRVLEPKESLRHEVSEVFKYLNDDWLKRGGGGGGALERKESMRTSHSSNGTGGQTKIRDKSCGVRQKSIRTLKTYGLETEVDKNLVAERVTAWISSTKKVSLLH